MNPGASYAAGKGVPLDHVRAYAWCSLAAAQGVRPAMQCTNDLGDAMTEEQIAEAEELSVSLAERIHQRPKPSLQNWNTRLLRHQELAVTLRIQPLKEGGYLATGTELATLHKRIAPPDDRVRTPIERVSEKEGLLPGKACQRETS